MHTARPPCKGGNDLVWEVMLHGPPRSDDFMMGPEDVLLLLCVKPSSLMALDMNVSLTHDSIAAILICWFPREQSKM